MRTTALLALCLASSLAAKDLPRLTVEASSSSTNEGIEFVFSGEADYPDGTVLMCCIEYMGEKAQQREQVDWARGKVQKGRYTATSKPIAANRRVFAGGSNLLGPDDVLDWRAFLQKVADDGRAGTASPGKRIWTLLEEPAKKEVIEALKSKTIEPSRVASIVAALNKLLQGRDFNDPTDFAGLGLPQEGTDLVAKKPADLTPWQVERLNRLLLEAAWDDQTLVRAPEAPYMAVAVFDWLRQDEDVYPKIVGDPRLKGVREVPPVKSPFQVGTRDQEVSENAEVAEKIRSFVDPLDGFVSEIEDKYAGAISKKEFCDASGKWSQELFQRWLDDFAPRVKAKWLDLNAYMDGCLAPKYPAHFNALKQTYLNVDKLWRLRVEALFKEHHMTCPDQYSAGPPIVMRPPIDVVKKQIRESVDKVKAAPPLTKPAPKKAEAPPEGGGK